MSSSIVAAMLVNWMSRAQPRPANHKSAETPDFIKGLQKTLDAHYREVRAKTERQENK